MQKTKDDILKILRENSPTFKSFGVQRLGLFGSFVHGNATASSDLDFIVSFNRKSFDSYMDLKFFLEELFERNVDLVLVDAIKDRLRASIFSEVIDVPGL